MKKTFIPFVAVLLTYGSSVAQDKIKDGTVTSGNTPAAGALLDLESSNRALLLPRVSLSATTSWSLNGTASASGGYTVYNTNASVTGTTAYPIITGGIGVYYWDGTGWVATKNQNATTAYVEPWYNQANNQAATTNTQNIYQIGNVAIGLNSTYTGATLQVDGAVRAGTDPKGTVGVNSVGFGLRTTASGDNSTAFGDSTQAVGDRSTAFGNRTRAGGANSVAIGYGSQARGTRGVALGYNTITGVNALDAQAFGSNTLAQGNNSTAFGYSTVASASGSTAFGNNSTASGINSTAFGSNTTANNDRSTAFGNTTIASGTSSTAFGYLSRATEARATAFGYNTRATGISSTAFGNESQATGGNSTAFGNTSVANGDNSTAFGNLTRANGNASTAFGNGSTTGVDAQSAIAMGTNANALHISSLVAGSNVSSTDDYQFRARFTGGYQFLTNAQSASTQVGVKLNGGDNAWSTISSKKLKENFIPVDTKDILAKIRTFDLTSWNYIGQDKTQFRHYGPMAEDFYAAFGNDGVGKVGVDNSINQADFDGVNFMGIQALAKENEELKARVEKLEKLLSELVKK